MQCLPLRQGQQLGNPQANLSPEDAKQSMGVILKGPCDWPPQG